MTSSAVWWRPFIPKLYTTLKHHYSMADLRHLAGVGEIATDMTR